MSNPQAVRQQEISDPEQWVDLHGDYLYRYALGQLRNPQEAENIVQETFLAAIQSKDSFSGRSSERTWLTSILKHKIIDQFRKTYREKPVTDLQSEEAAIDSFFDHSEHLKNKPSGWIPQPDKLAENSEFWNTFEECLGKLPQATANAFSMHQLEKIKTKEICKLLNISSTNLWVMLHRARLQLRQCLEENWFEVAK